MKRLLESWAESGRQLQRPNRYSIIIATCLTLALVCAVSRSAYGLPGVGQIVYDPSNFGQAAKELEQDIKLVEQAAQTYSLLQSELRMISQRPWQTLATTLDPITVTDLGPNAIRPAIALATAANGASDPRSAWAGAVMVMPMDVVNPALSSSLSNTSAPPTTSGIQITDAFATDSLRTIGTFRQNQSVLNSSIAALQSAQESVTDADNTPVAQQNITNGALLQILKLQQSNASIDVVVAEQLTAANSWQRNSAAEAITIQSQAIHSRASAPADYSNTSGTLTNYLID